MFVHTGAKKSAEPSLKVSFLVTQSCVQWQEGEGERRGRGGGVGQEGRGKKERESCKKPADLTRSRGR